jgi:hypothetical protein
MTLYACFTSHSFYMTKPFTSFLSPIILIISGGRYNLWSYTLYSFIQFLVTCSHKILWTDQHQHCSQTQSTVFLQFHRPSVTPTFMKVLYKHTHTHIYISTVMFSEPRKESKTFCSCSEHYCKLISSLFLYSAIFIP